MQLSNKLFAGCLPAPGLLLAAFPLCGQSLTSITDTYEANLPGSAFGWVQEEAHLQDPVEQVDFQLMEAIDWIIPNNVSAFGPGVFDRMAVAQPLISALEPSGFSNSGAHRLWDTPNVPFRFDNAELIGESPPEGYWGTSWLGDASTGGATWVFRVDVGAESLQIWHWWNHGLADRQTVTARLHNASGAVLAEHVVLEHRTTIFRQYTSIIDVSGSAAGDYLLIEHVGTNVGWRGSAVLAGAGNGGPVDPPPFGRFADYPREDGFAQTGDWLGIVFIEPHPYVFIADLRAWGHEAAGWLYVFEAGSVAVFDIDVSSDGGFPTGWIYVAGVNEIAYRHGDWFYFFE